ncbi:MAG: imidazole glycerol phosphate synthase subunit HisH [Sphaerochaetaceae bacterium]|nr:imidazole glycerol phosphate synthase subunit HisH [Sphaerochaetaceae bacterium]
MIGIIDYGMGNVLSIYNMLKKIKVEVILSKTCDELMICDKIILPGVGAFDVGMKKLKQSNLLECLNEQILIKRKPILGICLGMQMLGNSSEEGTLQGLNYIPFYSKKFDFPQTQDLKIPHMGWNIVSPKINEDPLLINLDDNQRYYFVHTYHAVCEDPSNILLECNYGYKFVAAVKKENIYGVQFHPEKSHKFGMALLENFAIKV